jgi:hypothetical protein
MYNNNLAYNTYTQNNIGVESPENYPDDVRGHFAF